MASQAERLLGGKKKNPRPRAWKSYKLAHPENYPDVVELAAARLSMSRRRKHAGLRAALERAESAARRAARALSESEFDSPEEQRAGQRASRARQRADRLAQAIERRGRAIDIEREMWSRHDMIRRRNPVTSRDRLVERLWKLQRAYLRAQRGWDRRKAHMPASQVAAYRRQFARLADAQRRIIDALAKRSGEKRTKPNPKYNGGNMAALNPWMYRNRRGRFTRRRKGMRRTWVASPGRARARRKGGKRRVRYGNMPPGLRRYYQALARGSRPKRRRAKRAQRRRGYGGTGRAYSKSYQRAKRGVLVSHRRKRRYQRQGGRVILASYGPQLPRTGAEKRAHAAGVSRQTRIARLLNRLRMRDIRRAGPKGVIVPSRLTTAVAAMNPRRRRRMRRYATTVNPRRRRVRGFRRVRRHLYTRNPGRGSLIQMAKSAFLPAGAGVAGGFVSGLIDTKLAPKKPLIQGLAKAGAALAGAFLLRKHPAAAGAFIGSTVGTIGYSFGLKAGGGMVADTKGQALQGIAELAAEDPNLANLINQSEDLGDLVTAGDLADGEVELADDEDDMGDLVAE